MTRWSLLMATLGHHWRANLAVGLGVVAATAVITGALVVGDSVQTSLLEMHLDRLGQVDMAIGGRDRFVREELAGDLQEAIGAGAKVAPLMMMRGSLETGGSESVGSRTGLRVGGVMIYGVDSRFWDLTQHGNLAAPKPGEVVLSEGVAAELGSRVAVGQQVRLWMELPNAIPRDTLLGERENDTIDMVLDVRGVVGPDDPIARRGVGRFDLNPSQQLPKLAYVALETLQETLVLNKRRVRNREQRRFDNYPARVNMLVVAGSTPQTVGAALARSISLEDLGLSLRRLEKHGYVALESNRMVLDDAIVAACDDIPGRSRVLVHLSNRLSNAEDPSRYSMYSIVAGLVPGQVAKVPFGPFAGGGVDDVMADLPDDAIVINRWLAGRAIDDDLPPGRVARRIARGDSDVPRACGDRTGRGGRRPRVDSARAGNHGCEDIPRLASAVQDGPRRIDATRRRLLGRVSCDPQGLPDVQDGGADVAKPLRHRDVCADGNRS